MRHFGNYAGSKIDSTRRHMGIHNSLNDDKYGIPLAWGGLSRHLIAKLYPVKKDGSRIGTDIVQAPITDANFETTLNWQSPFENAGPESKAPALTAMIQSGQLGVVMDAVKSSGLIDRDGEAGAKLDAFARKAMEVSKGLEGRTGITKLNSRQVFTGMPPVKLSITMHFRAVLDPQGEVVDPYRQLLEWALPQELSDDSALVAAMGGEKSVLSILFPSKAPQMVALNYGNQTFSPMVIEHVSHSLDVPRDRNGLPLYMAVQLSLSTLTALDRNDVKRIFVKD
jgi:hypothetical protein